MVSTEWFGLRGSGRPAFGTDGGMLSPHIPLCRVIFRRCELLYRTRKWKRTLPFLKLSEPAAWSGNNHSINISITRYGRSVWLMGSNAGWYCDSYREDSRQQCM